MYAMDDAAVALTLRAVVRSGLKAVLCVGEALDIREDGDHDEWVRRQLRSALDGLDERFAELVTIAYEPIWRSAPVSRRRRPGARDDDPRPFGADPRFQESRVLYGGSVNAENARHSWPRAAPTGSSSGSEPESGVVPCHYSGL